MKIVILLTVLFILTGCTKPKEHHELREMLNQALGMEVAPEFEVIDFDSSSSIGDYVEKYHIKFTEPAFSKAGETAKESPSWKQLQNGQILERVGSFEGHGFNGVIATISLKDKEVGVQFGW